MHKQVIKSCTFCTLNFLCATVEVHFCWVLPLNVKIKDIKPSILTLCTSSSKNMFTHTYKMSIWVWVWKKKKKIIRGDSESLKYQRFTNDILIWNGMAIFHSTVLTYILYRRNHSFEMCMLAQPSHQSKLMPKSWINLSFANSVALIRFGFQWILYRC